MSERTGDADDDFLARDPCCHAEEDLVAGVEVVKGASEGHDRIPWWWWWVGLGRWVVLMLSWSRTWGEVCGL